MRCAAAGMYRSGERVMCSCSTDPPTITSPVAPDRPTSNNGSKTFARHECATVIAAFTSCYVVKAGTSTRRGHVAFIASWVCNCATKRRNAGSRAKLREDRRNATRPNETWAMDFVHDQLATGTRLRVLTIVDTFSRFSPALEPRFSFRGADVVEVLEEVSRQ